VNDTSAAAANTAAPGARVGARIVAVESGSPADRAGLQPGMTIETVEGQVLRDIIDWRWLASEGGVSLTLKTAVQNSKIANTSAHTHARAQTNAHTQAHAHTLTCTLTRAYGEDWGISFADPLFDQLMTCRNSCTFCFMTMLPKGMRPALYLRDDDYRLSFLQGNFVTLTNMDDAQVERVIEQHLSPLHVSLHAVRPKARRRLMGANHARGLEVLGCLLDAGIEVHAQVVLVPGENDGAELDATLTWIEQRPRIISAGIVPYGFTKYARLQAGFAPTSAQAVIQQVAAFQQRSRARTGQTRFQLADEWYLLAVSPLPPAGEYDGYPQFEDGIGMVRSFIDDWEALDAEGVRCPTLATCATQAAQGTHDKKQDKRGTVSFLSCGEPKAYEPPVTVLVTGEAFAPILCTLLAASPFADRVSVRAIENRFFGGNVDVAGLLTAHDIIEQLAGGDQQDGNQQDGNQQDGNQQGGGQQDGDQPAPLLPPNAIVLLPSVMFNTSGLTLDDKQVDDIAVALDRRVVVVPYTAEGLATCLQDLDAREVVRPLRA
jgi:NifB/MoaA-like Fe-S oxidoreductase